MKVFFRNIFSNIYSFFEQQHNQMVFESLIKNGWLLIGRHTYGIPNVYLYRGSEAKVIIGNFCSIAPEVTFITGGIHPVNWVSTYPFRVKWHLNGEIVDGMPTTNGDIHVGSDVWIGTGASILSGVHIGHGAIIAAYSVVTRDIPPYAIAAGVPAKVIRYRFTQNIIQKMLEIEWWNWSEQEVDEFVPLLSSPDMDKFLSIYSTKGHNQ